MYSRYGTILAFDVKVTRDAAEEAARAGVKIFTADIIYHLFDQFTAYVEQIKKEEREVAMAKVGVPSDSASVNVIFFVVVL